MAILIFAYPAKTLIVWIRCIIPPLRRRLDILVVQLLHLGDCGHRGHLLHMEAALFFLVCAAMDSSHFYLSRILSQIIKRAHLYVLVCSPRTERLVVLSLTHLRGYRSKHYISSLFLLVRWILSM